MSDPNVTRRLNPITHPTVVIRRLVVKAERPARFDPRLFMVLERVAAGLCGVGGFVVVLGLLNASLIGLLAGFLFLSAGFSIYTTRLLLEPDGEGIGWDERFLAWLRSFRRRR